MDERTYDTLGCPEDSEDSRDDLTFSTDQEQQQGRVSLSMARRDSHVTQRTVLLGLLSALAVILLSAVIGLSVYYAGLTDRERLLADLNAQVSRLQRAYRASLDARLELRRTLEDEARLQQQTRWELDHQKSRNDEYQAEAERVTSLLTGLKSHIPLLKEGCRRCSPGWNLIESLCYYIPFSDSTQRRSWEQSRDYCRNLGADLIEINSREKQLIITHLITAYHESSVHYLANGFWMGARDVEEEGVWRWLDGTQLAEGFWNDGEPNNQGNEDCAAVYPAPKKNPFKSWNDAPCTHSLKWICEKAPVVADEA